MLRLAFRILTSIAAMGATMELCARLEDTLTAGAPLLGVYNHSILYDKPGPDFHGQPGARYLKWRMNSMGYRGPEPRPGAFRIACVGASETFGLYESENQEWPRQLERDLNAAPGVPPVTVINTAYAATNLRTHLHQAPRMLATVHPDMIVLYTSVAAYVHPEYYGVTNNQPQPAWHSRLLVKAKERGKRLVPSSWFLPWRRYMIESSMQGKESQIMDRLPAKNEALFASDLNQLLDFYAAHKVPVVLVTHANRFGQTVDPAEQDMLITWRQFYPMLREDGFLDMENRLNHQIHLIGAARGLLVVDAARAVPPGPRYFADFVHFTDAGAAIMAHTVSKALAPRLAQP